MSVILSKFHLVAVNQIYSYNSINNHHAKIYDAYSHVNTLANVPLV